MKRCVSALIAVIMITFAVVPAMAYTPDITTYSDAYVVIDAKTGQVLIEKNMDKREYPASITKIMTAALGLTYRKPEDTVTLTKEDVDDIWKWGETTHIALAPGEVITVKDALYGALVESANDCANAVAQSVCGDLSSFTDLMNKQVKTLGLQNTHFNNAHGLPDEQHYTTAYDMAQITRWALGVDGFTTYFGALDYTIPATNLNKERHIGTHHHMLVESSYYYPYAKGGKLGWTTEAQHTIVTWAEKDGLSLICVALNCSDKCGKYKDSIALFDYCFEHFSSVTVPAAQIASFDVPIGSTDRPSGTAHISASSDLSVLLNGAAPDGGIALRYDIPSCYGSAEEVDPHVMVYSGGDLLGTFSLNYSVETSGRPVGVAVISAGLGTVALSVLKWAAIVLGGLVTLLLITRAFFRVRRQIRRKRRAARY